jgi:hypothetical protein
MGIDGTEYPARLIVSAHALPPLERDFQLV